MRRHTHRLPAPPPVAQDLTSRLAVCEYANVAVHQWGAREREALTGALAPLLPHVAFAAMPPDILRTRVRPSGLVPAHYLSANA